MNPIGKLISGGQTGADQAALRAARAAGIPTGGQAPWGWKTEDGPTFWLRDYGLVSYATDGYPERTARNVSMADCCLWFGDSRTPGSWLTLRLCGEYGIDVFCVLPDTPAADVVLWLTEMIAPALPELPLTLLVAGSRESRSPGIGARVEAFLGEVFRQLKE